MRDPDELLSAALRGEQQEWPCDGDDAYLNAVIERGSYHGVLPLLHYLISSGRVVARNWPQGIFDVLREHALAHAMWELRHRDLLIRSLDALGAEGIQPVLFKGTALAYSLYPEPALRSRGDTDLIIPAGSLAALANALGTLGYERETGVTGESISYEASFTHHDPVSGAHVLDVHWRINNSEILSRLFSHEELLGQSRNIPELGRHAGGAGLVHGLLIACMHRATHVHNPYYANGVAHYGGDRLIWLYDIHLLATAFTPLQWDEFVKMAVEKGLGGVCLDGFESANSRFHTAIPNDVLDTLVQAGKGKISIYCNASALQQNWMDFLAIEGGVRKLRFVAQTLFPAPEYMRSKYPQGGWLPWLYFKRATGGISKKIRRLAVRTT